MVKEFECRYSAWVEKDILRKHDYCDGLNEKCLPLWLGYLKLRVMFGEAMLAALLEEVHH